MLTSIIYKFEHVFQYIKYLCIILMSELYLDTTKIYSILEKKNYSIKYTIWNI